MLVVFSDLHLEEEESRNIDAGDPSQALRFPRNINPKAFTKILDRLDAQAQRDGALRMDLVLAGDLFDLHRTALWFQNNPDDVRPYVSNREVQPGGSLEKKALEILAATNVPGTATHEILRIFRRLSEDGSYVDEHGRERTFPVEVHLYYIPGNHDRLANATPAIRRTVRQYLGLEGDDAIFPGALTFDEERAVVRHGHEYDAYNFSRSYRGDETIPLALPQKDYDDPAFGDFVTVDVASRLSEVFREVHGDEEIVRRPLLRTVYERILEFDDLRPMRAMLNFLLYIPDVEFPPEQIWREAIEPVLTRLLDAIHNHPYLRQELDKLNRRGIPDLIDAVNLTLSLRAWNWGGLSLRKVQALSDLALKTYHKEKDESGPYLYAMREETIRSGDSLFVVAGHTHHPDVRLIGRPALGEQYYVDTGTWRRQIPATPDYRYFGRIKSLSYAVLYGPREDPHEPMIPGKAASLDYWSGVTERWIV